MIRTLLIKMTDLKQYDEKNRRIIYDFRNTKIAKGKNLNNITSVILTGLGKVFFGEFLKFEDNNG